MPSRRAPSISPECNDPVGRRPIFVDQLPFAVISQKIDGKVHQCKMLFRRESATTDGLLCGFASFDWLNRQEKDGHATPAEKSATHLTPLERLGRAFISMKFAGAVITNHVMLHADHPLHIFGKSNETLRDLCDNLKFERKCPFFLHKLGDPLLVLIKRSEVFEAGRPWWYGWQSTLFLRRPTLISGSLAQEVCFYKLLFTQRRRLLDC